jgi:hypothetical protein
MNQYDPTHHVSAGSDPATTDVQTRRSAVQRVLSKKRNRWIVAAALTCAVGGVAVGTSAAANPSSAAARPAAASTSAPTAKPTGPGGAGGGARSAPAAGGTTGIVNSTSTSAFTLSTATGVKVTVNEASSTTYDRGTHHASASVVRKGASVLVLGTVDSATVTATQVIVQPGGDGGAAAAKAAGVIPFQQGTPSPTKTVGKIPSDYTEGEGTIVSGQTADKATEAAQAAFPGGITDRVVKLSNGEYEAHNISVNWPHHVFVSKDFKVVGAE